MAAGAAEGVAVAVESAAVAVLVLAVVGAVAGEVCHEDYQLRLLSMRDGEQTRVGCDQDSAGFRLVD